MILFGSYAEGRPGPDSDIDVLTITDLGNHVNERMRLRAEIGEVIGHYTPFEIHIVSREECESWYRRFIGKYVEIE